MHYDPSSTAIVLVEFQRQWTAPGLYHRTIRRELARLGSIENAAALAAQARRAGALVVHAPLVIDPARKRGTLAHLTRGRVFRLGSPSAALEPRVHEPTDLIATGRTAFDPFTDSTLHELLRQHGTRTVLFAGFATDQCVGQGVATAVEARLRRLPDQRRLRDLHRRAAHSRRAALSPTGCSAPPPSRRTLPAPPDRNGVRPGCPPTQRRAHSRRASAGCCLGRASGSRLSVAPSRVHRPLLDGADLAPTAAWAHLDGILTGRSASGPPAADIAAG
jgi:nicotinamidase-related amidase